MRESAGGKPIGGLKESARCALRASIGRLVDFSSDARKSAFVRTREMVNYT